MATDVVQTKTTLDALYKIVYPDGLENAIPEQTILQGMIPHNVILGEDFRQPVQLTLPGGVTYGGANTSTASGAYDLGEAIASESKKLTLTGSQITIREVVGYGAAKSAKGGPESFKNAVGHIFEGMALVGRRRIEYDLLWGQHLNGCGIVSATNGTTTITITDASWAPGNWIGCKGHKLIVATAGAPGTLRVGIAVIASVNFSTKVITVDAVPTSTAANDHVFWGFQYGSTNSGMWSGTAWMSGMGLMKAVSTTGTVWGQDNTAYELIRGEYKTAGSTDLSFDTLSDLLGQIFVKGGSGNAVCIVAPDTWTNLISPEVAARRHDASYKPEKVTVGNEAIEFRHITGTLKILPHPMMQLGYCLVIFPKLWQRVGATDLTFEQDVGANVRKIFLHVAGKNGFEVRAYSDQAPFTRRLGWSGYCDNIINS